MKLLFENWRQYLKEEGENVKIIDGFEPVAALAGRTMVVVDTSEGPTGFYLSSGTGTPGLGTEDMWLPFGGICGKVDCDSDEVAPAKARNAWIVKIPGDHPQAERSKMPKEGSEFHNIGLALARMNPKVPNWSDWMKAKGYPSFSEFQDAVNAYVVRRKKQPRTDSVDYGMMAVNYLLNSHRALKIKTWAGGKGTYGGNDPVYKSVDGDKVQLATLPQIKSWWANKNK